ncbi:MAG: hypothetical protein ABJG68_15450 [Crocinitomicaceae bacterium]
MRWIFILFISISFRSFAQSFESDSARMAQTTKSFEIMAIPALYYNGLGFGFGILKKGNEHVIDLNANYLPFGNEQFSIGLHYNFNRYVQTYKSGFLPYVPFWTGVVRRNVDNNYEDGGPYYDRMMFRLGSGFGASVLAKEKHYLRLELGVGASLNFEDYGSYDNESAFPFKLNLRKFELSNDQIITPALRLRVRYQFISKL